MQPGSITLNVDTLNDGTTIVAEVYTRYDEYNNRSVYIGESHDLSLRDMLSLYRTFPKASGNFKGVAKSAAKLTYDIVVPGLDGVADLTAPLIAEMSFSVPVGATDAQVLLMRQRLLALLDLDSVMTELNTKLLV